MWSRLNFTKDGSMPISSTPGDGSAGFNIYQLSQIESEYLQSTGLPLNTPIDSLSSSEQEALVLNLMASNPILLFNYSNMFTNAQTNASSPDGYTVALGSIESQKNQIISAMLDAWSASIAVQKELSAKAAIQQNIKKDELHHDLKKQEVIKDYIEWEQKQPDAGKANVVNAGIYVTYLSYLTQQQHYAQVTTTINEIVNNYYDKTKDPAISDSDLSRSLLSAVLLQSLVIVPIFQSLVTQPIEASSLSTQIGVNPVSDRSVIQPDLFPQRINEQILPSINFFVLDLVKDVSISLYLKQQESKKAPLDKDFANAFADKMMGETSNPDAIKERLIRQIPGIENASVQQLNDAVTFAQLFGLTSALALLVKVDGGTLQAKELKEMLVDEKGLGGDDKKAEVGTAINALLASIPEDRRVFFAEAQLRYLASMPNPDQLKDFMYALKAAADEVTMSQRAVQTRRD